MLVQPSGVGRPATAAPSGPTSAMSVSRPFATWTAAGWAGATFVAPEAGVVVICSGGAGGTSASELVWPDAPGPAFARSIVPHTVTAASATANVTITPSRIRPSAID